MRVLIIIPALPVNLEDIKGGVSSALSNLLRGLKNFDIEVRVVSFNREVAETIVSNYSSNITIYYTYEGRMPHVYNFIFYGSSEIKKHILEFNPSVVHFAMSGYILLTKLFGLSKKIQIVTIHGMAYNEARLQRLIKDKLVYYTNWIVGIFFCPKNIIHISNYSSNLFQNNKNSRTTIIPNAVNQSYFEISLKNFSHNKLLYIGSIEARKNILFILKALKLLIQSNMYFSLDILGDFKDESYKIEINKYIKANNLDSFINFHGWTPQQQVQKIMGQSDILVMSSTQETLPMVIAEAMSAGKVVVASNVGGISEMVTHQENGFVFDIENIENLTTILKKLHNNYPLMQQIQIAARKKAMETYHCDIVAKKTISFYKSFCENNL